MSMIYYNDFLPNKNKKYSGIHATRGHESDFQEERLALQDLFTQWRICKLCGEEGRSTSLTAQMRVGHRKRRQNCSPVRHLCGNSIEALVREAQLSRCYSARIECRNCGHWLCV